MPNAAWNPRNISHVKQADCWVFDLDNTLYPAACDLFAQVDVRMKGFISEFLKVDPDEAFRIQKLYFKEYGTTLRGLMSNHQMTPNAFLDYVHDVDVTAVPPSPRLDQALGQLPGRKVVFTNATAPYTARILERLGVAHHFDGVYDILDAAFRPKPEPAIYPDMLNRFGIDPTRAVMVEDMARNLKPAAALGMATVWVRTGMHWGHVDSEGDHVHHVTDLLEDWLEQVVEAAAA